MKGLENLIAKNDNHEVGALYDITHYHRKPSRLSSYAALIFSALSVASCGKESDIIPMPTSPTSSTRPALTVVSPNGGETLETESNYTVTWLSRDVPEELSIDIRLLRPDGTKTNLATSTNDGSETILVPNVLEGLYKVEVGTTLATKVLPDQSDGSFRIIQRVVPIPAQPTARTFVIAGDIAMPETIEGAYATANILDRIRADIVGTTGDHAYYFGNQQDFTLYYLPTWGRHRANTRPARGNHDLDPYYFIFFGANAGPAGQGYYSYTLGDWHMIVLDSNTPGDIPVDEGSAQYQWLKNELDSRPNQKCTLVYFHHPPISSGRNSDQPQMRRIWRLLYEKKWT